MNNNGFEIENGVLKEYTGSEKNIVIPNSVTEIDDFAFSDCGSLKSIKIPNSVTEIGDFAFSDCESLESIEIPNSVTEIGNLVFEDSNSLETLIFEDGINTDIMIKILFQHFEYIKTVGLKMNDGTIIYRNFDDIVTCDISVFDMPEDKLSLNGNTLEIVDDIPNDTLIDKIINAIKTLSEFGKSMEEIATFLNISQEYINTMINTLKVIDPLLKLGKSYEEISRFLNISTPDIQKLLEIENILLGT